MADALTFRDFKIKQIEASRCYVTAICNENGREAYAEVNSGPDALERAKEGLAKLKLQP